VLVERGHLPRPEPGQPGIFAIPTPERLRELLSGAGFGEIDIEEIEMAWTFNDFDDYWGYVTSLAGALAMVIKELPRNEQDAIRTEVARGLAQYERNGRYAIGGVCVNAVAS
jgi:hypothetical protein